MVALAAPKDTIPVATHSGLKNTTRDVGAGQYSGITYLGNNQYAVVHDKLGGGGILFFSFIINDRGEVGKVSTYTPSGTAKAQSSGWDNEGIAYNPATGMLYVSAEANQSIREYSLPNGTLTGRSFAVPEDLGADRIQGNRGFEALTFNAATGLFWTVTEYNLKADNQGLLRLQSFHPSGQPAQRFIYQMDAPERAPEDAAKANAYVFGVPALAALDNGGLVVMEREVYVRAATLTATSRVKLFLVHPGEDESAPLSKTLLTQFSTSGLNLANYEGMCLGPVLSGGRQTLVLIPDSQDGLATAQEFIKIITLQ